MQRRAKCLEVKEDYEKAKEDLDRAHMLDKENPVIRTAKEKVQGKLNTIKFDEYREVANQFLKQKKF